MMSDIAMAIFPAHYSARQFKSCTFENILQMGIGSK